MRALFVLLVVSSLAPAATLPELVAKEEGVDFGECVLTPKPKLAGNKVHLILPARFPDTAVWQTFTVILAGVNGDTVTDTLEFKIPDGFNPRESNASCKGSTITLREEVRGKGKPKVRNYQWDGTALKKR